MADIIKKLEEGVRPWEKSWKTNGLDMPRNSAGRAYRGMNVLLLWSAAMIGNFNSPYWITYAQARKMGGFVKKGEKSQSIIFWKTFKKEETNEAGGIDEKTIPFMKWYAVFNAEQCENLPEKFYPKAVEVTESNGEPRPDVEAWIAGSKAFITHKGERACYSPKDDYIKMPERGAFKTLDHYYGTTAHEMIHWTGYYKRLKRFKEDGGSVFGSEEYAKEELIAELGAAFVGAQFGLPVAHRDDHASYLASWLKKLKDDKRFLLSAASKAQQAVDFINKLVGVSIAEDIQEEIE
jgi:antirestriction protein ArdC